MALAAVVLLLGASVWRVVSGEADAALRLGLPGGLAGFAATAVGALPALLLCGLSNRTEDSLFGLAAGMMLAASSFSLILPGLAASAEITGSGSVGALVVVAGLGLGVLLNAGARRFHAPWPAYLGAQGAGSERVNRVWLFVPAIA